MTECNDDFGCQSDKEYNELVKRANTIRDLYIKYRRMSFKHYNIAPQDNTLSKWCKIALVYRTNAIDPKKFIEYLGTKVRPYVPVNLLSSLIWIKRFNEEFNDESKLAEANAKVDRDSYLIARMVGNQIPLESVLTDTTLGISPLMIYCLAVREPGCEDIAKDYEDAARMFLLDNPYYRKSGIAQYIPAGFK